MKIHELKQQNIVLLDDEDYDFIMNWGSISYKVTPIGHTRHPTVVWTGSPLRRPCFLSPSLIPANGNPLDLRRVNLVPRPTYKTPLEADFAEWHPLGARYSVFLRDVRGYSRMRWVLNDAQGGETNYPSFSALVYRLFSDTRPDDPYVAAYREWLDSVSDCYFPEN